MIIEKTFSRVLGMPCWNAEHGYGSFLTFEFGSPHLKIRERYRAKGGLREKSRSIEVYGDWHLWIYLCDWTIISHQTVRATSQSSRKEIGRAMARLNGQNLINVLVDPSCATIFEFELGDRLETMPNVTEYGQDSELWHLFEFSGNVLTVRADQKYSYQTANRPKNDELWYPLLS